jgi:flagellar biosynthesis/type III secretory pathway M-ring protein FliF/YscJ
MVLIGAGVVMVVITLIIIFFSYSNSTSKGLSVDLVKGIEQDRAFEIISKLKIAEINADIQESERPGKVNVKVFEKDFDKAAIALSRSDLLQEDGFNLFDKSDWAASDYDKRIKMMRAVNGDLSRIVSRMTGIKWSTVRVNIPEPQLFSQYQAATTATVQIELVDEGVKLSRGQVKSVINLLIGYVPNLQKNNISIIDTAGQTYSAVESDESNASELLEESEKVNKVIQKKIEEYLEPLIGYNNYIVRVSSEISRKKVEESATTFTDGAVGQEQIGDERLGAPQGQAFVEGQEAAPAGDSSMSYTRTNRVTQRYPSYKQKTTSTPAGRISKITVAVAINDGIPAGISLKQIREGVAAITSPNTSVDDVKITIAEFATGKSNIAHGSKTTNIVPGIGASLGQATSFFKGLPKWMSFVIAGFGLLLLLGSFGRRPATIPQESTIAQINQSMQRQQQFQKPGLQLGAGEDFPQQYESTQQLSAKEPDFTGIISGLKEAAEEKPEFLANKLQIWLEDGR